MVSMSGGMTVTCPHCGHSASMSEWHQKAASEEELQRNPISIVDTPPGTKITHFQTADGDLGLDIPRTGKSGGLLFFAAFWLLISLPLFLIFASVAVKQGGGAIGGGLLASIFPVVGFGMLYFGMRMKYSQHRIFVDPTRLVYQTEFFNSKKVHQFDVASIRSVMQKVFYTQNYQPVYGIEIVGNDNKTLKFGTQISPEEKRWIVWLLREALAARGNEAMKALLSHIPKPPAA